MLDARHVNSYVAEGHPPAAIARELNVTTAEVITALALRVLAGDLRWSDVYLNYPKEVFDYLPELDRLDSAYLEKARDGYLEDCSLDVDDLRLFCQLRHNQVLAADLFVIVTQAEKTLHERIRLVLQNYFLRPADAWWSEGVPQDIRVDCATMREKSGTQDQPLYCFTSLIDLTKIVKMKKNSPAFSQALPKSIVREHKPIEYVDAQINQLNQLRNRLMHPVRDEPPTREDYRFARAFHARFIEAPWREVEPHKKKGSRG